MTAFDESCCGSMAFGECLLNQLRDSEGDLPDDTACNHCLKTLCDLEHEVVSLGSQLKQGSRELRDDAPFLYLIEQQAATRHEGPEQGMPPHIGAYQIGELLGSGGMGAVYRATHRHLKKEVAIKLLPTHSLPHATATARFEREMEAVGKLEHPNVIRALDAGQAEGKCFLIMELVPGADLARLIAGQRSLRVEDACEIVRQAALGLAYTHDVGLIHRDIKPANLMLTTDNSDQTLVKVMDLGLALLTEEDATSQLTDQGQLMGTLEFMAPEQATHSSNVDHRADIYALGATLFRLLTGSVPFGGPHYNTPVNRLHGLANDAAPSITERREDVPADLSSLIDRMLSRDPAARPQTMKEVADFLEPFTSGHDLGVLARQGVALQRFKSTEIAGSGSTAWPRSSSSSDAPTLAHQPPANGGTRDESLRPAGPDVASSRRRSLPRSFASYLAGFVLFAIAAGTIWLRLTDGGYLRIEADPGINVAIEVSEGGRSLESLQVGREQHQFWLRSGNYEVRLPADARDSLTIEGDRFELTRNGNPVVKIARVSEADKAAEVSDASKNRPGENVATLVVTNTDDHGTGSLRHAIENAAPGDIIRLDKSLDGKTLVLTSGELHIDKNLTIDGCDLETPLAIDGAGLSRVIQADQPNTIQLSNLIITGGRAQDGAGISGGAFLTLKRVTVCNNVATGYGGGIHNAQGGLTLIDSTVTGNAANVSGGISVWNAPLHIQNSTISANSAIAYGGGLATFGSCESTITNGTFSANTAPWGSAAQFAHGSTACVRHTTFADNTATDAVGGGCTLFVSGHGKLFLENSLVVGNKVAGDKVAHAEIASIGESSAFIGGGNLVGSVLHGGESATDTDTIAVVGDAFDPMLRALGDYGGAVQTMPPRPGSRVIDAGVVTEDRVRIDARGTRRPLDGDSDGVATPDVGAVEFVPPANPGPLPQ